jgi:hypothetical protein
VPHLNSREAALREAHHLDESDSNNGRFRVAPAPQTVNEPRPDRNNVLQRTADLDALVATHPQQRYHGAQARRHCTHRSSTVSSGTAAHRRIIDNGDAKVWRVEQELQRGTEARVDDPYSRLYTHNSINRARLSPMRSTQSTTTRTHLAKFF